MINQRLREIKEIVKYTETEIQGKPGGAEWYGTVKRLLDTIHELIKEIESINS